SPAPEPAPSPQTRGNRPPIESRPGGAKGPPAARSSTAPPPSPIRPPSLLRSHASWQTETHSRFFRSNEFHDPRHMLLEYSHASFFQCIPHAFHELIPLKRGS